MWHIMVKLNKDHVSEGSKTENWWSGSELGRKSGASCDYCAQNVSLSGIPSSIAPLHQKPL